MTSLNTYFDAIKSSAKTLQEKATKITDVIDDKLKKTSETLERQRIKAAEASESESLPRKWRSSSDNPLGEVITVPTPVPNIPPVTLVVPERSNTLTVDSEPQTVSRRRSRRLKRASELDDDNERQQQLTQSPDDIINKIDENEKPIVNELITTDDFIENTSTSKEEFNSLQNEDYPDLIENPSNTVETNLLNTLYPLETSLEKSDRYENNFSIKPSEEQFDINTFKPPTQQTTVSDRISQPLNIPTITIQDDSTADSLPASPSIVESLVVEPPTPIIELPTPIIELPTPIIELPEPVVEILEESPTPIVKKEKRFPLLHCYALPPDIIVSHMSASSTHIYICTDQHAIFYAKALDTHLNYPLQWYNYTLPAERIIVSNSNQTIWRVFDKTIYSSSDTIKLSPLGIYWSELSFSKGQEFLSISITDQYGWYIKEDGTLWLIKIDDEDEQSINVACPFDLNNVVCCTDKTGVTTRDGQILIRIGCTNECPEGDGWIFIEHNFDLFNDFSLIRNNNMICIMDKKHRLWVHDWSVNGKFYEILRNEELVLKPSDQQYKLDMNDKYLCFTDCREQIYIFSNSLIGIHWLLIQKETRLQRLICAFPNEDHVWALTTDGMICSSNGQILEKPRQAQYLSHASFVPNKTSQNAILWSLDDSCNIYIRENINESSQWEQLDQSQFDWNRRLVDLVCNTVGVWAVDDQGAIHFRYGHTTNSKEFSVLNPAWIPISDEKKHHRSFAQIFCGPEKWMVYATDIKQNVYARIGIVDDNLMGTAWNIIEDCTALELAISEHTLWLLTSRGHVQCRENISLTNPIGTRTIYLPGRFNSITVSTDDDQMWTLYPPHHLFKLDRLTILFEK